MARSSHGKHRLIAVAVAGAAAGVFGGFAKLGWEVPFPPRTPQREETNPPQKMLQQVGFSPEFTHRTLTVSGHEIPVVSLTVHFAFSVGAAVTYAVAAQQSPVITTGRGTAFGVAVWGATHIGLMTLTGTVPPPSQRPVNEHLSEFFGHAFWMWTTDAALRQLLPGQMPTNG